MKSLFLIVLFLFANVFIASANLSGTEEAFQLLSKELNLSAVQKPGVKSVLGQFSDKFASISSLSGPLKTKAADAGFGDLKGALSKILNAEQLAKFEGLKAKLMATFGIKL